MASLRLGADLFARLATNYPASNLGGVQSQLRLNVPLTGTGRRYVIHCGGPKRTSQSLKQHPVVEDFSRHHGTSL